MKFSILVLLFFIFPIFSFSQSSNIEAEILNHEDNNAILITKGRSLLIDYYVVGNVKKVKEIKDFLISLQDSNFYAFNKGEYFLILYFTNEFNELSKEILRKNFFIQNSCFNYKRVPAFDDLDFTLFESSRNQIEDIKRNIFSSNIDNETKQFLNLHLTYILLSSANNEKINEIISMKKNFIAQFPTSKYRNFVEREIFREKELSGFYYTFSFSSGVGILSGNLKKYYSMPILLDFEYNLNYKKIETDYRLGLGINKTKQDLAYSTGVFKKNKTASVANYAFNAGYNILNLNRLKITPFAGIYGVSISPNFSKEFEKNNPDISELSINSSPVFGGGFNIYYKFKPAFSYHNSFGLQMLRLRLERINTNFTKNSNGMNGNINFITLGIVIINED